MKTWLKAKLSLLTLSLFILWTPISEAGEVQKPVEVPVLGYHHLVVSEPLLTKSTISVYKFEQDLQSLKRSGYHTITFKELYDYTHHKGKLPTKPVMITFDDGYSSNYELAYPVLKRLNMKATIFVIGWCVGAEARPIPYKPHISHFTWEQAKEMSDSGLVEIESHTYDLHEIGGLASGTNKRCGYGAGRMRFESDYNYVKRISTDFELSEKCIRENVKKAPLAIAYPFGKYDTTTERVAREYFKGSLTVKPGVRLYATPKDLYDIPRILINEKTSVLSAIVNWEMQPWEPFLTDLEADMLSIPNYIATKLQNQQGKGTLKKKIPSKPSKSKQ